MKFVNVSLITAVLMLASFANAAEIMGFQAWKSSRVDEARSTIEKLQKSSEAASKGRATAAKPRVDQKLQQAQASLEIAQELNVNDYFVLYLSQFKQRDSFVEAAKKLSPEESADLMIAYQKHLTGVSDSEVSVPSTGGISSPTATITK